MSEQSDEDLRSYQVVVNHEEQYSVWPAESTPPAGWTAPGFTGTKQECLDRIAEVWTDMRPLSLRRAMAGETS
ncbi:MbtH family protein [Kitasatospora sp. NPDC056076]|uniref:MbtH family protein n=1 Tax=unclassified Kitasatospora TaxID=2633591 RepID=UPI0035D8EB01